MNDDESYIDLNEIAEYMDAVITIIEASGPKGVGVQDAVERAVFWIIGRKDSDEIKRVLDVLKCHDIDPRGVFKNTIGASRTQH